MSWAALLVGYFGVNAFSGNHGLKAKQDIDQQIASMSAELDKLRLERNAMGAAHCACSNRAGSIPTCSTSGHARCSIMHTPTI